MAPLQEDTFTPVEPQTESHEATSQSLSRSRRRIRLPLGVKLLLLAAPALIGFVILAVNFLVLPLWRDIHRTEIFVAQAPLTREIGALVHALQIERGSTNGFVTSRGGKFTEEMTKGRQGVDAAWQALQERTVAKTTEEWATPFGMALQGFMTALSPLKETRQKADGLATPAPELVAFYSQTIAKGLVAVHALERMAPSVPLEQRLASFASLLEGKEYAGQERALLSAVLTQKAFTVVQFRRASELAYSQDKTLREFASGTSPEWASALKQAQESPAWAAVAATRDAALQSFARPIPQANPTAWFAASTERINSLYKIEGAVADAFVEEAKSFGAERKSAFQRNLAWTIGGSLAAIGLVLWQARAINRSITGAVRAVASVLSQQAESVKAASHEISDASHALAKSASEQAAALEETGATFEELNSQTHRNAEHSTTAAGKIRDTRGAADRGAEDITKLNRAMAELKESSDNVAKIVKTIDEIAFQTNLLALNAAVEAARAGEAGLGFAVVADEVRALAQRSAHAAKDTAQKIETAIQCSHQGVTLGAEVGESLETIVKGVREVDKLISEIASASNEQSQGLQQISVAISEMDKLTQGNAASAEETASATEVLDQQAKALRESVTRLQAIVDGS